MATWRSPVATLYAERAQYYEGMPELVTGFLSLDAMNWIDCPLCYQSAGTKCVNASRKRGKNTHPERSEAYLAKHSDRKKLYAEDWRVTRSAVAEYNKKLRAKRS